MTACMHLTPLNRQTVCDCTARPGEDCPHADLTLSEWTEGRGRVSADPTAGVCDLDAEECASCQ